jgi:LPS-assembly lipoprotein
MTTRAALAFILIIAGFALAGCGLTPVYGTHANGGKSSPVTTGLNSIYIESIPNRTGQKLRNMLMDRLYQNGRVDPAQAAYRLDIPGVTESIYGLGIAKDATATRSQITLTAVMSLMPAHDLETAPMLTRSLRAISSFNTLASQYTTLVTEEDARDQTIRDLADQIVTQLELYFSNPGAFPGQEDIDRRAQVQSDAEAQIRHTDVLTP